GAQLGGNGQALAFHLLNRGFAAALAGDLELALAVSGEAWDLARELEEGIASMWAEFGLAAVHMESGNPTRAVELFVSSGGGEDLPLIPGVWRILTLEWLTRCWLALGRREEAERSAATAEVVATATPLRLGTAWAERAAAAVALDAGDAV